MNSLLNDLLNLNRTLIVGVLNVTPDSFSDGGNNLDPAIAIERAHAMVAEGADIIDVGGESTRPGAVPITLAEEMQRVLPVVQELTASLDVPVSIDTYKSQLARETLEMGAEIINDISGLRFDSDMAGVVAYYGASVIIMHMKGTPRDMQIDPHYDDLMGDLEQFFVAQINVARTAGIRDDQIVIDPGIGFGKTVADNFIILNSLQLLVQLGFPVMVGPSRKSFIGSTLDLAVDDRLEGTASAITAAILNGARIVRVHDVKEMKRVAKMTDAIRLEGAAA
ncbi:MAG: dihydropteroate synthase [Candidatus Marinimicrobia bacterium]|jgi:dihydropteroate synthase|nr:dihydropteroate synthase [Candidatus Neomarinimicrobiota bacterium]MDP6594127.1 dihydropteroate synthase [Candidatus Neomarinimicrobiota bacterium]MDP6835605.1 dihydropteroate synthase [Candidatus Neomarinimicrobiota bacterium]MDP6966149.1 dihydropteroate synthase [Candidatus Neomarinimicrobiota bacterium]|tara:strand:+ start:1666 stop:2505 length:840 start_codon:yes stop_codon:yes gene_type:complete